MSRNSVKKILQTKFSDDYTKYERKIYNMCIRLAKNDESCIDNIYSEFAFEKCGELLVALDDNAVKTIITDIENDVVSWESCSFDKERLEYEKEMDKSVMKPTPVKGVYFCKEKDCNSDEFYTWSKQTRSADEGTTEFRECAKCGKRGKR